MVTLNLLQNRGGRAPGCRCTGQPLSFLLGVGNAEALARDPRVIDPPTLTTKRLVASGSTFQWIMPAPRLCRT